uniref:SxtJ family membrane protein n=1 Tax=Ningiella ruwaisensis TaxID=2364274 RepID=UPI00109F1950|nr:SxtJ family membrane protein [Ningiella ruwaisensis]
MQITKSIAKIFSSIMLPMVNKSDTDALQSFALTMAIAFPFVFMGLIPWLFSLSVPLWPALLTLVLMLLHIVRPGALYPIYVLWMFIASVLGWLNTKVILGIAYVFLIVPTGIVMQLLGKLQYQKRVNKKSTWVKRETPPTAKNLKEPF